MEGRTSDNISRRKLLRLSLPLLAAATMPALLHSCSDATEKKSVAATKKPKKPPVQRGNPYGGMNVMFLHHKNRTLHYPFIFKTYPQLKEDHFQQVDPSQWQAFLDNEGAHFPPDMSGHIFERQALNQLQAGFGGLADHSFSNAASILSRMFQEPYRKSNMYNWRSYDLLAQLIAVNGTIAPDSKAAYFLQIVPPSSQLKKIPRRNEWIRSEETITGKMNFIAGKRDEYLSRLSKRMI